MLSDNDIETKLSQLIEISYSVSGYGFVGVLDMFWNRLIPESDPIPHNLKPLTDGPQIYAEIECLTYGEGGGEFGSWVNDPSIDISREAFLFSEDHLAEWDWSVYTCESDYVELSTKDYLLTELLPDNIESLLLDHFRSNPDPLITLLELHKNPEHYTQGIKNTRLRRFMEELLEKNDFLES